MRIICGHKQFDKADEISTQHIHKSISHCFKSKVAVSIIGGAAAKLLSDLYQTFLHSWNVRNNITPSLGSVRYLVRFDMEPKLPRYHDLFGTSLWTFMSVSLLVGKFALPYFKRWGGGITLIFPSNQSSCLIKEIRYGWHCWLNPPHINKWIYMEEAKIRNSRNGRPVLPSWAWFHCEFMRLGIFSDIW